MNTVSGVAEQHREEDELSRLSRLLRMTTQVASVAMRARDVQTLFDSACRIAVEDGPFLMAWVGLVDEETSLVRVAAQAGADDGYLASVRITCTDEPEGRGPTGSAVRTGHWQVSADWASDPAMSPWREEGFRRGFRSSAAFPLRKGNTVVGALTLYSDCPHFFLDEEVRTLVALADDLSFAIRSYELEQRNRAMQADLERLASFPRLNPGPVIELTFGGEVTYANPVAESEFPDLRALGARHPLLAGVVGIGCRLRDGEATQIRREVEVGDRVFQECITLGGAPDAVRCYCADITAAKQAEVVRVERNRLRGILGAIHDGAYITNGAYEVEYVNPVMERDFGPVGGRPCYEYLHGRRAPCPTCPYDRVMAGQTMTHEWHSHITHKTYELLDTPLRDTGDGGTKLGFLHDITPRKQMEAELRASEARYRSLFENMLTGFAVHEIITDDSGRPVDYVFLEANAAFGEITGLEPYDIIGKTVREVLPGIEDFWVETYGRVAIDGEEARFEHYAEPLRKWYAVLAYQAGQGRFATVVLDVTDRRLASDRVEELNRELQVRLGELTAANSELEAFSYSVSHDLRAPLRAIDGFSRIVSEEYAQELCPEVQRYLGLVCDNARQMGRLIDGLLTFSRLGRQHLDKQRVAPDELVRQSLDGLREEWEGRDVEIEIADLPTCYADPGLLSHVFANLLSNALKFSRERRPARIEVGCTREGDEAVYFVSDNGVGFDMQYADKLFGVFQRLHRADQFEGTGVGLSLVQRIIHRHGGRIWATAEPGKGATFRFILRGDAEHD